MLEWYDEGECEIAADEEGIPNGLQERELAGLLMAVVGSTLCSTYAAKNIKPDALDLMTWLEHVEQYCRGDAKDCLAASAAQDVMCYAISTATGAPVYLLNGGTKSYFVVDAKDPHSSELAVFMDRLPSRLRLMEFVINDIRASKTPIVLHVNGEPNSLQHVKIVLRSNLTNNGDYPAVVGPLLFEDLKHLLLNLTRLSHRTIGSSISTLQPITRPRASPSDNDHRLPSAENGWHQVPRSSKAATVNQVSNRAPPSPAAEPRHYGRFAALGSIEEPICIEMSSDEEAVVSHSMHC